MFTKATLVSLDAMDRGALRAVLELSGTSVKPVRRDYEFSGTGLVDTFLVDAANRVLDELNTRDAFVAKLAPGTVLVDRG